MIKLLWFYTLILSLSCCKSHPQQLQNDISYTGVFIKRQNLEKNNVRLMLKGKDGLIKEFIVAAVLFDPLTNFINGTGINEVNVVYNEYHNSENNSSTSIIKSIMPVYRLP